MQNPERRLHDAMNVAPLPARFAMHDGSVLSDGHVAYETWGTLNGAGDNALLLFTGLSPSAHAAASPGNPAPGWWEAFIGPGKALDTTRFFVVCVNSLGSCFGSSGPSSIDPATGNRWGLRFPRVAVEDIATAARECLRHLGIRRLHAVLGPSLGGMSSLAFVALFPGFARRLVCISGSDAASPAAIALRSIQREAVMQDPNWLNGEYSAQRPPFAGMRLARKIGTTTYRSAREWNQRFSRGRLPDAARAPSRTQFGPEFQVEAYLEAQAVRWATVFDANCYLYLSRAMDLFQLDEHAPEGRLPALFAAAGLDSALVIGVETDTLFPIDEQARVAAALREAGVATTFAQLDSIEGHDAFLVDVDAFDPLLRRFLGSNTEASAA